MNLNKTILVNQGQAMITEAINTSQPIILTKFTIGKGTVATENAALALTNVVLSHRDVAIANNTQEGNVYKCTCYYDNKTEPADVTIKEIGLYGKVGASGTVKLFAYVTFEPGDYLPIGGGSVYSEYSKVLNVGITELATVQSVVNIIVENATKTSLGVVQIGNGVAVNTNGVISLGTTNDGLIINASDIKLDTQNTLTSTSITKPLSANMGKQLQDTKANGTTQVIAGSGLTGGGDLSANRTINVVSANAGITVNADNIELKPATTSVIGGVKPDGTTTSVDVNGVISTVNRASISTQIIAGTGLTGGGDLTASRTLAVASATDGIVVNADNIQLSTIDNLTTVSTTQPLSAGQGKILQDTKANGTTQVIAGNGLTGGGDLTTDRTLNIVSANAGIVVNADNIQLKPATTSIIGGVKPKVGNGGGSTYNATTGEFYVPLDYKQYDSLTGLGLTLPCSTIQICDAMPIRSYLCTAIGVGNMSDSPNDYGLLEIIKFDTTRTSCKFSRKDAFNLYFATRDLSISLFSGWKEMTTKEFTNSTYVKKAGDTMTGALNGTTATFSGDITAPNIITNTSIGTCTTLFSGTQQCGQNTWKDTGIDIPTTYSSVLIGVNQANSGVYDTEIEFSRCTLTRGQTLLFAHQTQDERIMGKIIGDRLWTYTSAGNMTDNNLKTVYGITRR